MARTDLKATIARLEGASLTPTRARARNRLVVLPVRGLVDGAQLYAVEGHWMSLCAELGLGL